MTLSRVLVNGAGGRIGRAVTHEIVESGERESGLELVAVNEVRGIDYLLENYPGRDSVHGKYDWRIEKFNEGAISINGRVVRVYAEKDITKLPLKDLGVEIVTECSGFFGDPKEKGKDSLSRPFLDMGAQRVMQCYPAKTADISLIMGANHELYNPSKHRLISNASCTTKSLALPLQIMLDNGIEIDDLRMVTAHAATNSQGILDSLNHIVTHSTGAAKALGGIIPRLEGRMGGTSARCPTLDGSISYMSIVAYSANELSAEGLNDMFRKAVANPKYAGRFGVLDENGIGTSDIVERRENALIISSETQVGKLTSPHADKKAYHLFLASGYDNELGSSVDPVLLTEYIAKRY